jgi:hypothetical protein
MDERMSARRRSRPFGVSVLAVLAAALAATYLARLAQTLLLWEQLGALLPFSPLYLALSGLVWGLVGLALAPGVWFGAAWAPRFVRWAAPLFSAYYWLEYIILVEHAGRSPNWPFLATLNLALLIWGFWVLSRRKTKRFFGEKHERRSKNTTTA